MGCGDVGETTPCATLLRELCFKVSADQRLDAEGGKGAGSVDGNDSRGNAFSVAGSKQGLHREFRYVTMVRINDRPGPQP